MALCFISHFNRASTASAGDEKLMKTYAISTDEMGLVYTAFLFVYTLCMVPGGWFIDRYGPRMALILMGLGSAFFCAYTGLVGRGIVAAGQVWVTLLGVRSLMASIAQMSAPRRPVMFEPK